MLEWNVYLNNNNRIEAYNVFNHYGFYEEVKCIIRNKYDRDEFSISLKNAAMYYFLE